MQKHKICCEDFFFFFFILRSLHLITLLLLGNSNPYVLVRAEDKIQMSFLFFVFCFEKVLIFFFVCLFVCLSAWRLFPCHVCVAQAVNFQYKLITDFNTPEAVVNLNRRLNFLIDVSSFLSHCSCERAGNLGTGAVERKRGRRGERGRLECLDKGSLSSL